MDTPTSQSATAAQAAALAPAPCSARVTFDVDAEISRLRQIVIDVHEMAVQSPYFGRIAPKGAAKLIAEIAKATDQPFPPRIQ